MQWQNDALCGHKTGRGDTRSVTELECLRRYCWFNAQIHVGGQEGEAMRVCALN